MGPASMEGLAQVPTELTS